MNILCIDTANSKLSIAVSCKKGDFFYKSEQSNIQAEKICKKVDEILEKSSISLDEITHFSINTGPGSFTGIRIGVSYLAGVLSFNNLAKIIEITTPDIIYFQKEKRGKTRVILKNENSKIVFVKDYESAKDEIIKMDIDDAKKCDFDLMIDRDVEGGTFDKSSPSGMLAATKNMIKNSKNYKIINPSYCKDFF